jgi:hypothetical protein
MTGGRGAGGVLRSLCVLAAGAVLMAGACTRHHPPPPRTTTSTTSTTSTVPVTVSCDGSSLHDQVRAMMLKHTALLDDRCEGTYAVYDVDWGAGICWQPETPNPCAGQRTSRLFLQAVGATWTAFYQNPDGGCGDVTTFRPDFPTSLCADLDPLPGGTIYGW